MVLTTSKYQVKLGITANGLRKYLNHIQKIGSFVKMLVKEVRQESHLLYAESDLVHFPP